MFTAEETQTRRQIWWVCCLADRLVACFSPFETTTDIWLVDRYGSIYMGEQDLQVSTLSFSQLYAGRPIIIRDDDFDTPIPAVTLVRLA